jgi:hypothetical protein
VQRPYPVEGRRQPGIVVTGFAVQVVEPFSHASPVGDLIRQPGVVGAEFGLLGVSDLDDGTGGPSGGRKEVPTDPFLARPAVGCGVGGHWDASARSTSR